MAEPEVEDAWPDVTDPAVGEPGGADAGWEDPDLAPEQAPEADWPEDGPAKGAEDDGTWTDVEGFDLLQEDAAAREDDRWPVEGPAPTDDLTIRSLPVLPWRLLVDLPEWGVRGVEARCAPSQDSSVLRVSLSPAVGGSVRLALGGGLSVQVAEAQGHLLTTTAVKLPGGEPLVTFRLAATTGPPVVELGRDALAGRYLVDPGADGHEPTA